MISRWLIVGKNCSMKRVFDIMVSAFSLLLLWPLLLFLAALVKAHDGGSVFFRQQRVGRNGENFKLLKFRSMTELKDAENGEFEAGSRKRVTPVGKILRKTKLDELPQLWNVVCGDMSLVGPRPEVRKWVEAYPARWALVHAVSPGITDPASIHFRNEEEILARSSNPERTYREEILPCKLTLYEHYVHTHSFLGDIKILIKTVWVVLRD